MSLVKCHELHWLTKFHTGTPPGSRLYLAHFIKMDERKNDAKSDHYALRLQRTHFTWTKVHAGVKQKIKKEEPSEK